MSYEFSIRKKAAGWYLWEYPWHDEPESHRYRLTGYESDDWAFYYWFLGWDHISLGIHIYPPGPNIEIHLPGGFCRIGRKGERQ